MLKIKRTYLDFLKSIHIGTRAYIIELTSNGYKDSVENLSIICASFSTILIKGYNGDEPFKQKSKIGDLCKAIQKLNPYTHIIIQTNGSIRPTGMNSVKNIEYLIYGELKKSGKSFSDRINELTWQWLGKAGGKFIFDVYDTDEFDEINLIISGLLIKKNQVYINILNSNYTEYAFVTKNNGYNIYVETDYEWCGDMNSNDKSSNINNDDIEIE